MKHFNDINGMRCLLIQRYHYNPNTGIFRWRIKPAIRVQIGDIAGSPNSQGYVQLYLGGLQKAHRLAWLYCYGYVPPTGIDHEDGDKANNRLANLRLCMDGNIGQALNQQNRKGPQKNNSAGLLGAYTVRRTGKFSSLITVFGERIGLGTFDTAEEASEVYLANKRLLHEFNTL